MSVKSILQEKWYMVMKSCIAIVCGLCAFEAMGFPLNPSFAPEAVKEYKVKADAGDAEAQYLYSYALSLGVGTKWDHEQAFSYAKKAVAQGCERALSLVGRGYENGWCDETDATKAAECYTRFVAWAKRAAAQGDADAQLNLADMLDDGKGGVTNKAEAVAWFRRAAEQGDSRAQCDLGFRYATGHGVATNLAEAVKWWLKSAEQGWPFAQYDLNLCYWRGDGVEKNEKKSVYWLQKAAEGLGDAQARLAVNYARGNGGVAKNMDEAFKWAQKAAENGHADADVCSILGTCYANGNGVEKDMAEAVKWYRKGAERGLHTAQRCLGWCYENGAGVARDAKVAEKWYDWAADGDVFLKAFYRHGKMLCSMIALNVLWFLTFLTFLAGYYRPYHELTVLRAKRSLVCRLDISPIACFAAGTGILALYFGIIGIRCFSHVETDLALIDVLCMEDVLGRAVEVLGFGATATVCWVVGMCKWKKAKAGMSDVTAEVSLPFVQYTKLCLLEMMGVVLPIGLVVVTFFALAGEMFLLFVWMGVLAVGVACLWPTRKEYAKLTSKEETAGLKKSMNWKLNLFQLAITLLLLPFTLEQVGEATGLFHLPALAWVKGLRILATDSLADNEASVRKIWHEAADFAEGKNGRIRDPARARKLYLKAGEMIATSDQGGLLASLGTFYDLEQGPFNRDYVEAAKWYRKGVELGNCWCMGKLSVLYREGRGVEKSVTNALKYAKMAANENLGHYLAEHYERGLGVEKDLVRAFELRKSEAQWLDPDWDRGGPSYRVGELYEHGIGTPTNLVEAVKWYSLSLEQGNKKAKKKLEQLEKTRVK